MFTEGIFPIGDGLLDIDEARLKSLLVQDDINEIYEVEQTPFARGKFAAVRRAVHKDSGVHFAAKFLKRRRRAQSSDKEIKHEIAVLTLCDGAENIVKLNAVHESRSDTALLLELATGGELQTFLDNEECLSETDARFCMREVLKGLQFLHKRSIAHLDLKPQNILLTGERIEDGLKLCDFGISRVVVEGTNVREIVGTPDYVAPEVLQYEPLSLLTDIWSVGVLAYVLLSGFSPFGGETKQETFLNISQCALTFPDKLFGGVSAAAIDFIRRALRIKPSDRMTAAGCLEHFWLKDDCSIDRHLFENGKSLATLDDENDENDEDDEHDISIETDEAEENGVEEEFEISSDENNFLNGSINGSNKMESSDIEVEQPCTDMENIINGSGIQQSETVVNGITKTTNSIHTIPAARATTIPLCHTPQQQQQQQQQQQPQQINHTARRHSTDSNKENTYLATKKIIPANNIATVVKKSTIQPTTTNKSTATIIIATEQQKLQQNHEQIEVNNIIATISLENGSNSSGNSNSIIAAVAPSFFPDAPTTPKVIRKAPTTDASPTSVKALVKKFQLEGAEKHLKEAQSNQQQQPQQYQLQHTQVNGVGPRKSMPALTNGKFANSAVLTNDNHALKKLAEKCTNDSQQSQHIKSNNSKSKHINNNSFMSNGTIATHSNSRRLSEPITAVHHHQQQQQLQQHFQKKSPINNVASTSPPTSPLSTASDTVMSYKTTCVYCLTCGSSSSTGCANNETNSVDGCRHSSTASTINGSSSRNSTTATATSTAAAAILLSNHQQMQHHTHPHHHHHHTHHRHHHHHVVVAKNVAANKLSLDQGIIC